MPNRRIDMLRAAMPYTMPNLRKPIQILIQLDELTTFMQSPAEEADMEACDLEGTGNVEAMMESLREFCTSSEKETIDLLLNYIRVQKMYQNYRGFASSLGKQQKGGSQMVDFLMSQLTPEQRNTFAQMSASE